MCVCVSVCVCVCLCFCDVIMGVIKCAGVIKVLNLKHEMCDVIMDVIKALSLQHCRDLDLCGCQKYLHKVNTYIR